MTGRKQGPLFSRDRMQLKNASMLAGSCDIPLAESLADCIKLVGVLDRQVRRPAALLLDQFDGDLGSVLPLMNDLDRLSDHRAFRLRKSSDQRSVVGRYPVMTTAGPVWPAGIPHRICTDRPVASCCKTRTEGPRAASG